MRVEVSSVVLSNVLLSTAIRVGLMDVRVDRMLITLLNNNQDTFTPESRVLLRGSKVLLVLRELLVVAI